MQDQSKDNAHKLAIYANYSCIKGGVRPFCTFEDQNINIFCTGLFLLKTDQIYRQKIKKTPKIWGSTCCFVIKFCRQEQNRAFFTQNYATTDLSWRFKNLKNIWKKVNSVHSTNICWEKGRSLPISVVNLSQNRVPYF